MLLLLLLTIAIILTSLRGVGCVVVCAHYVVLPLVVESSNMVWTWLTLGLGLWV